MQISAHSSAILACVILASTKVAALPAGTGGGILGAWGAAMLKPAFNKAFGIESLCCGDAAGCITKAGTNDKNETWQACYGAGRFFISNKGSECEAWGPDSKMLNAKVSYIMGNKKISSEASLAMQDALQHMVNENIEAGPDAGLRVAYTGPTDAPSGPLNLVTMAYKFGGDEQC